MRCRLSREYTFEAAHHLPMVPPTHRCSRIHGHSYRIEVVVAGDVDPDLGWLMDFDDMDACVMPIIKKLDHRYLNDIGGLDNPTSEVLALWLWHKLFPVLPYLAELSVSETPTSKCTYRGL